MIHYYPKRPVKSFQDLEVYQKTLGIAVILVKKIKNEKISTLALDLPVKIATAHSLRFSDQNKAIQILEEVMLNCNLLVVYLELHRDLSVPVPNLPELANASLPKTPPTTGGVDITDVAFYEEQIKNLLSLRMKILHLQMSWKKFMREKAYEK